MKNKIKQYIALTIAFYLSFCSVLSAQTKYKISDSKEIEMKLSGTSTLHDWEMNTKTVSGEAQFSFKNGNVNQLTALDNLNFSLAVLNLKSDNKELDKNAYKALKTKQYKNISYKLTSSIVTSLTKNTYSLKTQGNLTVAGVTKEIIMDVICLVKNNETIACNGTYKLNMTDFNVKPPSFMLGAMKTGEIITLDFTMVYQKLTGISTINTKINK